MNGDELPRNGPGPSGTDQSTEQKAARTWSCCSRVKLDRLHLIKLQFHLIVAVQYSIPSTNNLHTAWTHHLRLERTP